MTITSFFFTWWQCEFVIRNYIFWIYVAKKLRNCKKHTNEIKTYDKNPFYTFNSALVFNDIKKIVFGSYILSLYFLFKILYHLLIITICLE